MSYTIARKSPVTLILDGEPLAVPRARRPFFVAWASEIDARKLADATAGMGDEERARWRAFYDIMHTTDEDLAQLVNTPEGGDRVIRHCLREAGVSAERAEEVLEDLGYRQRYTLAAVLAKIVEPEPAAAPGQQQQQGGGDGADPLAGSGRGASAP